MSEELNLPESLERLEISPENCYCHASKTEEDLNRAGAIQRLPSNASPVDDPERFLENLSIKAVCTKGNCSCNKKRDNRDKGLKRLVKKRPILRRSRLSPALLRAPVLRLAGADVNSSTPTNTAEGARSLLPLTPDISSRLVKDGDSTTCPGQDGLPRLMNPSSSLVLNNNNTSPIQSQSASTCCAVQARLLLTDGPPNSSNVQTSDDTSMDELASYFDLFVHIPKKMSQMAEMMYI